MNTLSNGPAGAMLDRARTINETVLFVEIMRMDEVEKEIVELNTDQMRLQYINSDGVLLSDIGGGYADSTVQDGGKSGKFKVDLYDSGSFHESFRIENVSGTGFDIKSDPVKSDGTNLLDEWGEEVEGLTFESLAKASAFLVTLYQEKIRKILIG